MGGSTMKTAKVWKYFIQLPSEEQAAECKICCKRIKATNSSTTGMIRHLRSCHSSEYQILQATQQHITTAKQESETFSMRQNNSRNKSKSVTGHSVANIIATTFDLRRKHLENSIRFMYVDSRPEQKKARFDNCCNAVDLRVESTSKTNHNEQTEKVRLIRENFWPDDHPDAQRISDQIGIMLLLDNESPAIISRAGFRNLIRFLQPRYQLPSAEQFHKVILPRLIGQLRFNAISLQQAGYFSNQQSDLNARLNSLTAILLAKECGAGNSISTESSELSAFSSIYSEQKELERVVINSIRSAQNISQSFSHSIQLCGEDTDPSLNFETPLSARIHSFMKSIGECVFPQAELTDLVTRCYYACQHSEKFTDDGQHQSRSDVRSSLRSLDLADCVEYVHKNLERIHEEHKRLPIPMFKPFTVDETQFLSDLNMHIHSMYLRS